MANKTNYYSSKPKEKKWVGKLIAVTVCIAALVVGVCAMGIGTTGFKDWSFSRWFPKTEAVQELTETSNGGAVISEGESNGIRLMSTLVEEEDYEEYGISAQSVGYTAVITAEFTPASTTDKSVTWTCNDTSGMVTVTPVADNQLQATVTVTGGFSEQVTITCTSKATPTVKATATVDYMRIPSQVCLNTYTVNSILTDDFEVGKFDEVDSLGVGTLKPTSYKGTVRFRIDTELYDYLITKFDDLWAVSADLNFDSDEIYGTAGYNAAQFFCGTTASWEDILEEIANYFYGKSDYSLGFLEYYNVASYYGDVKVADYPGTLISALCKVNSIADIIVTPTGIDLDNVTLIFGENGVVS